ncbi:MAG: hypothetical protein IT531_12850 [Burkholderiales bacterium]|nr:hypothetical protein [Burkholderiales bacterium]
MAILVRRSNLLVAITDAAAVADSCGHDADAVTLDLEAVAIADKPAARALIKDAIGVAGRAAAEVFVRTDRRFLHADLAAAAWPGLSGIMLSRVECAADVTDAAEALSTLERSRGIEVGSLSLIVLLESARAVWDMRAIFAASSRISQAGLDEPDLAMSLGFEPDEALDPFVYARGRLAVEATAAGIAPVGMAYPLSVWPRDDGAEVIEGAATRARNLGMKGAVCPHASWVKPVNAAFTPSPELVAYNKRVRAAFAAGIAAGTAAVPLDGRMIDVPVDEWAIVVLATAEACAARDAEKRVAGSDPGNNLISDRTEVISGPPGD